MINAIIRGSLGEFGSALLDFYIGNNLWINAILLLYALFLVLAKNTHKKMKQSVKDHFFKMYGEDVSDKSTSWFKKTLERNPPDWEKIQKNAWWPLISIEKSLWFQVKSSKTIQEIFTPEKIHQIFQD